MRRPDDQVDRGAHFSVTFTRCARGFILRSGSEYDGSIGVIYAFDRIEDVGAWFIEQYGNPAEPETRDSEVSA
jgi:hypothetical protein